MTTPTTRPDPSRGSRIGGSQEMGTLDTLKRGFELSPELRGVSASPWCWPWWPRSVAC